MIVIGLVIVHVVLIIVFVLDVEKSGLWLPRLKLWKPMYNFTLGPWGGELELQPALAVLKAPTASGRVSNMSPGIQFEGVEAFSSKQGDSTDTVETSMACKACLETSHYHDDDRADDAPFSPFSKEPLTEPVKSS